MATSPATLVTFDNVRFESLVTGPTDRQLYQQGPYIKILHRVSYRNAETIACYHYPERLITELWPECRIGDEDLGRAVLFEFNAGVQGFQDVLQWTLVCVINGRFDDLASYTSSRRRTLRRMRTVADIFEMEKLIENLESAQPANTEDTP
ncbi:hypothetical protein LTR64_004249 [Lithohypha guttulata]|uniref:Uncharacterized protein n=1 Tax=Lithohypha guttulata TaxID=1690604 RepID=A0AAN7YJE7_9EURO|nr:hypothetical protein LTR51_006456 [Lithohypha guttulata]KAK5088664.1 hypothetical protein LTR05_002884 [Lithohypha guttulata]